MLAGRCLALRTRDRSPIRKSPPPETMPRYRVNITTMPGKTSSFAAGEQGKRPTPYLLSPREDMEVPPRRVGPPSLDPFRLRYFGNTRSPAVAFRPPANGQAVPSEEKQVRSLWSPSRRTHRIPAARRPATRLQGLDWLLDATGVRQGGISTGGGWAGHGALAPAPLQSHHSESRTPDRDGPFSSGEQGPPYDPHRRSRTVATDLTPRGRANLARPRPQRGAGHRRRNSGHRQTHWR